jgi:hypothetical protein
MSYPGGDDDYPVPQVRATRVPLQPRRSGDVRGKPKSRTLCELNSKNDDSAGATFPRVASTSTVLAPIGTKTNYVGPALLRSRKVGLKRSGSPENSRDESESLKKPRSEPSAPFGYGQSPFHFRVLLSRVVDSPTSFTARRTAQFRVPFKVPFNTVSADPQATSKGAGPTCDKARSLRDPDGALEEAPIDLSDKDEDALSCGLDSFQPGLKCGHF